MVAWRWFVDGGCRLMWWLVWGSRFGVVGQPQAVLSFGPSAPLHPPAALRLRVPAYGRGWPGSSEQHRLRPCISTPSHFLLYLPPALYVRRVGSQAVLSFGPSAPLHPPRCASLAGTRLRPRVARVLRTTPLTALHIHSFPLLAAPPPALYVRRVGPQAVLSFGPSAPLHPPPLRFACGYPLTAAGARSGTIDLRTDGLFQIANTLDYNNRL